MFHNIIPTEAYVNCCYLVTMSYNILIFSHRNDDKPTNKRRSFRNKYWYIMIAAIRERAKYDG